MVVNLKYLNVFKAQEEVNLESLKTKGILAKDLPSNVEVKILGEGEIGVPLIVLLPTSKGAREKIEKAGGRVEVGSGKIEVRKEVGGGMKEITLNKKTEKKALKRTAVKFVEKPKKEIS